METPNNNNNNNENNTKHHQQQVSEGLYYQSPDGLVSIAIKIASAKKFPQHGYPIVVLRLIPSEATRVQLLEGTEGGIEYLASYDELKKWLETLALADQRFSFSLAKTVRPKSAQRKEYWRKRSERRFGRPGDRR